MAKLKRKRRSPLPVQRIMPWIGALVVLAIIVGAIFGLISFIAGRRHSTARASALSVQAVANNSQWTPKFQDFDGVTMALVPPGCFTLGIAKSQVDFEDESPATRLCFDQPFWIDKTDVTQAQFKQFGGQAANSPGDVGDNRPVENITWFEAHDFCENKRDARLPTEAEWEYAARGPDDLIYPWSNTWDPAKAVWGTGGTADVGSKPAGASWVGALDMSGNVWQWVSTLYKPYPYNKDDGRESESDTRSNRVLRGGAWNYGDTDNLRAASRYDNAPSSANLNYGFRCASS